MNMGNVSNLSWEVDRVNHWPPESVSRQLSYCKLKTLGYELVCFSSLLSGKEVPEQDEISAF